jgi:hypothetical protein
MNVLLLSMPDYFEHMPPIAVRMPLKRHEAGKAWAMSRPEK